MTVVRDIITNPDLIMGCKAVFGTVSSHVLCFAGRGAPTSPKRYYMLPAGAARRAVAQPYIIAIGGGAQVRDGLKGCVVNIAKAGTVYGDTATLLDDPVEVQRLARWPVAIVLQDVWQVRGNPRLVEDLGMPDRLVLEGAVDGIVRHDDRVEALWKALVDWPLELASLPQPANFFDSGIPTLAAGGQRPVVRGGMGSDEGKRVWKIQLEIERRPELARAAKQLSADRHGVPTCAACEFAHADFGMFDAHHPNPLATGERQTLAEHLIVLCPTCHRRAHRKDRLIPYTLLELSDWIAKGRL